MLHPEVDRPMEMETCEEALLLSGEGLPHGRLRCLNKKVKPTLTTSYTRLKAGLPKDSPIVQPRRKPRRSRDRDDVSFPHFHPLSDFRSCMAQCLLSPLFLKLLQEFDAAFEAALNEYQVAVQQWQVLNSAYMAWVGRAAMVRNNGESHDDIGPMPPMPGPLPTVPTPSTFAATYYASTPPVSSLPNQMLPLSFAVASC
jgi:hypothetical protein